MELKNRINENFSFTKNSILKVPRTKFDRNQRKLDTFNPGELVPLFVDEILPGDTYKIDLASVVRFNSPLVRPVMDTLRMDVWAFFVPTRLVENNWEKLIGNYRDNPDWTTDVNLTMSNVNIAGSDIFSNTDSTKISDVEFANSVMSHMGLPRFLNTSSNMSSFILAPFRAYALIWDNWFRDEALQRSILVNKDFESVTASGTLTDENPFKKSNFNDYLLSCAYGGMCAPLNKIHDYFTSCLPNVQKGAPVGIFGNDVGTVPVLTLPMDDEDGYNSTIIKLKAANSGPLHFAVNKCFRFGNEWSANGWMGSTKDVSNPRSFILSGSKHDSGPNFDSGFAMSGPFGSYHPDQPYLAYAPDNLYADLSGMNLTINDLRLGFQTQLIKETDARYGSRYTEYLMGHWGVLSSDSRLQIPEFLGSAYFFLDMQSVPQTSATGSTPQANQAAYSLTNNVSHIFEKSFTEHGYVIIVGGVRIANHTYSSALNKMWSRQTRYDFYFPELSNIGEQPVYNYEIYNDNNALGNGVFGYQEAWANYRYLPNLACGYMNPYLQNTLAAWNYADKYEEGPTLSSGWMKEDSSPIYRSLAVTDKNIPVFLGDFYFKNECIRPMPLHSVPGLIDHSGKIIL